MSYEVQFQHEGAEYKVIGPDIDGMLKLILGLQDATIVPHVEERRDAAEATLKGLKYEWRGGEQWVPPIGQPPAWVNEPAKAPWYPDDSGDWVEGDPVTDAPDSEITDWLLASARRAKEYFNPHGGPVLGRELSGQTPIVAYRVVKPCE